MHTSKKFIFTRNAILQCFQNLLFSSTLQKQIKAYVPIKNVYLDQKRYFAVFSTFTVVIQRKNLNEGICTHQKSSSSPETLFCSVFQFFFFHLLYIKAYVPIKNGYLDQKRLFAVFSTFTFVIQRKNVNKGICTHQKSSSSPETLF